MGGMGRNDLLTETERTYLNDPEGFDRADSTIRKMNHDLRKKVKASKKDVALINRFLDGEPIPEPNPGTLPNPSKNHSGGGGDNFYPSETTKNRHALLTPSEREYIMDPEEYAQNHANSTVSVMNHNLKQKSDSWDDTIELLNQTFRTWDRVWLQMDSQAKCISCGREEQAEVENWQVGGYGETFPEWHTDYGFPSNLSTPTDVRGFCPECSHIHKDTINMAMEEGKAPCYGKRCNADTHRLDTEPFEDCWKTRNIWLNPEDMDAIIEQTDHLDDGRASEVQGLY